MPIELETEVIQRTPKVFSADEKGPRDRRDIDQAYLYMQNAQRDDITELSPDELKKLRRKIDFRIVPIMFCCYTMQFIDRVSLNYAAVMGLNQELKLKGNEFSNAATWFFIAFLIAEIPNAIVLQKVPVAKWLGANVTLWGIATACTAAAHNYTTLLAARILLPIFEAAIAPCLMLISSQWYTKSEQPLRFSIWYAGLGIGQIIGGIVSYAFQQIKNPEFSGWRVMFVVLGVVTVLIGLVTLFALPDTPMKAHFLSEPEKIALLKHVAINQTGIANKKYKPAQVFAVVLDVQLWLMTVLTISISISSGVVSLYSATLIRNFGYTPPKAALLNTPSGLVSIASTILSGYGIRHTSNRWAWLVACCIPGILGGGLMSFATGNKAAQLAGIYLVNGITAALTVVFQWTASNVAGQTKRVIAVALVAGSFSVGSIIGPQTFQAKDAPQYLPAKIAVLATQSGAALIAVVLFLYYVWANKRKDTANSLTEGSSLELQSEQQMWEDRTDKENPTFSIHPQFVGWWANMSMTSNSTPPHIIIIGAGINGLVLAQALKKNGIPYTVFEQDSSVSARGRGWGLTIHWSLDTFISLLPKHLVDRLPEVYVDPEASKKGENGNFLFFDLRSGEARWKVPPNQRIRVSRERLRALLLEGLDVKWSKTLSSISTPSSNSIVARFADSTSATGTLVIGADGAHSSMRAILLAHTPGLIRNTRLPVRLLGVSVIYPSSFALQLRSLDPFFFFGGDPKSDTFIYFSFLDTPSNNGRKDDVDTYECQIMVSWPYREGFMGMEEPLEVPSTNRERITLMKLLAEGWIDPFRACVMKIPEDTAAKVIVLEDFVPKKGMWNNLEGRVTMVGDAAHAMTMFRGEGANHGIQDVSILLASILPEFQSSAHPAFKGTTNLKPSIDAYEQEMIKRTAPAVLTSRRACLDAHDYKRITDQSPLVSRRVMVNITE